MKLLKVTTYLDRQDVSHKLIEHLKHSHKIGHLENNEVADLYSSMVLTRLETEDRPEFMKLMKTLEYVLLRRIHSMQKD